MAIRRRRHSTPVTVAVTPTTATTGVAATQQFTSTLTNVHGASALETGGVWTSSNTAHATVNTAGLATAVNLGTPTINFYTYPFLTTDATPAVMTVVVGAKTKLAMDTQPSTTATTATPFATQPAVQLQDAAGNDVAEASVTITAAKQSGSGTLGGTLTAVTDGTGVATFTDLQITGTGAHTLVFTGTGLTSIISGTITVS